MSPIMPYDKYSCTLIALQFSQIEFPFLLDMLWEFNHDSYKTKLGLEHSNFKTVLF